MQKQMFQHPLDRKSDPDTLAYGKTRSASPCASTQSGGSSRSRGTSPMSPAISFDEFDEFSPRAFRFDSIEPGVVQVPVMERPRATHECTFPSESSQPFRIPLESGVYYSSGPLTPPMTPRDPMEEYDPMKQIMKPGDVLFVPGSRGGLAEIGTTGGFLGHFIVVLEPPRRIKVGTQEAQAFKPIWPVDALEIWHVCAMESTRGAVGLSNADLLMRVDPSTGKMFIFGEVEPNGDLSINEDEACELWQSPGGLRRSLQRELIQEVVEEMMVSNGSWSMTTAARAFFRSASAFSSKDKDKLLEEILECWNADPICTSVVIVFWQRYICKLADVMNSMPVTPIHASDLILKYMPVKADRSLPGEIIRAMKDCSWTMISEAPLLAVDV